MATTKCVDSGDRFYYYIDEDLNGVNMSERGFFNYPEQPIYAPSFVYENDTDVNYNNLKGVVFQFAYRYVYADGRRSAYSPYSEVATQSSGEDLYGEALDSVAIGNKLVVYTTIPSYRNELSSIEVVFRRSSGSGWGKWILAGYIKQDRLLLEETPDFDFYNDVALVVVDDSEVEKTEQYLPVLADAQTSLTNNRVAYGGVTEGYDNPELDVSLTSVFTEFPITQYGQIESEYEIVYSLLDKKTTSNAEYYYYYNAIKIPGVPSAGNSIVIKLNEDTFTYVISGTPSMDDLKAGIVAMLMNGGYYAIVDEDFPEHSGASIDYDAVLARSKYVMYAEGEFGGLYYKEILNYTYAVEYSSTEDSFDKIGGFKTGAIHPFCLYYYDELMRRGEPVFDDDMKLYLPFITEQDITTAGDVYRYSIDWEISHRPPSWAKYWRFGYAGNTSVGYFVQYSISNANNDGEAGYTEIYITPLQTITTTSGVNPYIAQTLIGSNIPPYEWEKGDRVRFITPASVGEDIQTPFQSNEYIDGYYDYEIVEYEEDEVAGSIIRIQEIVLTGEYGIGIGAGSVIEIYRPKKQTEDDVYFEHGRLYRVSEGDDGLLYHEGDVGYKDQAYDEYGATDQPATGKIVKGDIYHLLRIFSYKITTDSKPYPVESYSASDFYDSSVWGKGKVGFGFDIGRGKYNNIRYSDPLIQDTRMNGLSSFEGDNYVSVNRKHGLITGLREIGHTLRVFQESNTVSIGVGRTEYDDATGTSYVVQSDKILGSQRISTSGYGCINPESILSVGYNLYWFDAMRGCMIRDSGGGAFPISGRFITEQGVADYKMEKFFKYHAKNAREGWCKVFTAWSDYDKLLYVYFKYNGTEYSDGGYYSSKYGEPYTDFDADVTGDECVVFHEPSNRWTNVITMYGLTYMDSGSNSLISFIDDTLLLHNHPSSSKATFNGVTYGCGTWVYSSEANNINKIFNAIAIHASVKPDVDDVRVYTEEVVGGEMRSRLYSKLIKKIEGVFRSAFLRNGWVNSAISKVRLYSGDFLRGKILKAKISYDETDDESDIQDGITIYKVDYDCEIRDY